MSINGIDTSIFASTGSVMPNAKAADSGSSADFASILADFNKTAGETPYERIRDAVLEKHGMSEQEYSKLNGPEKDAIDKEIQDAIKKAAFQGPQNGDMAHTDIAINNILA
jgi:hypothetical protein